MAKHKVTLPWDLEKDNIRLFIKSIVIAHCVKMPVDVEVFTPSTIHVFTISD
ncbi:hypothetical protein J2W98_000469 [Paenibacillus peoriae]|uniref:Uncharacterized protein n=1 Tax=Paenibacillus peoriae TaxID=59893 RepID=A0ABU1Q9C4_9BACL|nr:hypothetical protein [Paenibacillus peoriae]